MRPNGPFIRTCQECGHKQEDVEPFKVNDSYRNRKCKACKSEALDFGSYKTEEGDEDALHVR